MQTARYNMKRVISFDIGIKNLAYCLGTYKPTQEWNVEKWGVLDLSGFKQPSCQTCGKNATFMFKDVPYCGKHCRATGGKPIPKGCSGNLMKKKLVDLKTIGNEIGVIDSETIIKKADLINKIQNYLTESCYSKVTGPKAAQVDMIEIGRQMAKQLDSLLKRTRIDSVLVENQIGTIATRMRTIQGMVYQYFILRHPNASIQTISAHNKLNITLPAQIKNKIPEVLTASYKDRKKSGVLITRLWLEDRGDKLWLAQFIASKKKDDLADSLLQMIWYVQS